MLIDTITRASSLFDSDMKRCLAYLFCEIRGQSNVLASHLSQSHSTLVAGSLARKPATAKRDLSSIPGFLVTTSPRASPGGGGGEGPRGRRALKNSTRYGLSGPTTTEKQARAAEGPLEATQATLLQYSAVCCCCPTAHPQRIRGCLVR